MSDKTTPRPWRVYDRRRAALPNIAIFAGHEKVGEVSSVHMRSRCGGYDPSRDSEGANAVDAVGLANAELIVRCVNSHDALVEACEAALNMEHIRRAGMGTTDEQYSQLHTKLHAARARATR